MMELKVAMIAGLIVTAPYALTQIWGFVAAGLYPHERKWVRRFTPVSIALFFVGAAFMLLVVAPVMLDFLLSYRSGYPRPEEFMPVLLHGQKQEPLPASPAQTPWPATLPAFTDQPPPDFPDGVLWLNPDTRDVNVRYGGQAYRFAHLEKVREHDRLEVEPMIRMSDYLLLVLGMMAAFGIGFQIPVVVALIATLGIATAKDMAAVRRHVIFAIAIAAAVITPSADLASMLALMIPMVLLFEAGLVAARFIERERASHSR
jgi:Sec-independent protein secretion pathway component TatC